MKKFAHGLVFAAVLAALGGCAIGPDYHKPASDLPQAFKEDGKWKVAQPMDEAPKGPWWQVFQDAELNRLMDVLNKQSPTIAQAEAQYRQAHEQLNQAEASLFPSVGATAGATRGTSGNNNAIQDQYSLQLNASWEIDIWGTVRRAVEAGEAKEAASAAQLEAIRLSSQAQLATAYLQLRVADQALASQQESVKALSETLRLTRNQYNAGTVDQAGVFQAESQLKSAQAQLTDKQITRDQFEHAIAAALGLSPSQLDVAPVASLPHLPVVPAGVPSTLLERRPDIAVAERNMAVANAQIGIAEAAYFPTLTISANGGYKSSSFADWLNLPNRIWSLGPQLAMTIFDAGARKAATKSAIAAYDASVASYRQTVISAMQSVEDNLTAQRGLLQEVELQKQAVDSARKSETIALNQYRAGTVSYLNVLIAQNSRINAEASLWTLMGRQYAGSVALISALGGKW